MTLRDRFPGRKISRFCDRPSEATMPTMRNVAKVVLFQAVLSISALIILSDHNCYANRLQSNQFSHQSEWSPLSPSRTRVAIRKTKLKPPPSDGANIAIPTITTTTNSPPDIQKLLEDYVTYLSTLPDFQRETNLAKSKARSSRNSGKHDFSTPESLSLISTPIVTANQNQFNIDEVAIESRSDKTSDIILEGAPSNTLITPEFESDEHGIRANKYYLEMPTESGLTLNLSDEELSSFIDNVLGGTSDNETGYTTTKSNDLDETPITMSPHDTILTLGQNKSLINLSDISNSNLNFTSGNNTSLETEYTSTTTTTAPSTETTTDSSFSRAEIFENSDETYSSNEENINFVSKEIVPEKESDERFYTSDSDFVTEPDADALTLITEPINTGSNDTLGEEDKTSSNNFKKKLTLLDDTELLRELKKTKDLLRIQMEKLHRMENSSHGIQVRQSAIEELTTTTLETTTVETTTGLSNVNDSNDLLDFDKENQTTTSTELPPVTESAPLFETTIAPSNDENSTTIDCSGTTTEQPDLSETTTTTTTTTVTNENYSISNYSRANLEEPLNDDKNLTSEGNEVFNANMETTTTLADENPFNTANSSVGSQVETIKTERNAEPETNSIPIEVSSASGKIVTNGSNYDDALQNAHVIANDAENSTSSVSSLDLTVANSTLSLSNTSNANDNGRNETDSETMILTHVPKITIIHKIMKPNGNKSKAGQSEEEAYREALRKHKDLIKTAMSSISLYPAAFKRYKINNNNKVNIGEIYLLPNFAGSAAHGRAHEETPKRPQMVQFDRKFLQLLGQTLATNGNSMDKPIVIRHAKPSVRPKFAYKRIENKFNAEDAIRSEFDSQNGVLQENRAKLYVSYLNSFVAKNQNPENILKLYRPRFFHRKRFKKVRLPHGFRVKKKVPITTITTDNNTMGKQVLTYLNSSPILITIAQNNEQHNQTIDTVERPQVRSSNHFVSFRKKELTDELPRSMFKVFCTYDAHRSLSFPSNDSRGRFFDINQLEQNSAILNQCTHLVYAFANINMNGEVLAGTTNIRDDVLRAESEQKNQASLVRLKNLKERFPHLRLLVALGGWNTPPQLFSLLVATSKLRDRLSQNVHKFVLNYDFDGAIISWFYPVYGSKSISDNQRSTRSTSGQTLFQLDDKQNLVKFIRSLRTRFDSIPHKKLEIGLMSPPFEELIDRGYDVPKLNELVDHMILMTYDYYGSWDDKVHHFAPLYPLSKDQTNERDQKLNINYTLNYWLNNKQAPRDKTLLGVAFYGRSFTLENPSNAGPGAKAIGPGIAGPITNKPGLLAFNELCDLYLGHPAVRLNEDEHRITAHLQLFDQWVGFDDELSLYLKTKYAIANNLSGIFIWSINHDDYRNRCGWGRFPLLNAINKAVEHCNSATVHCKM